MNLSQFETLTDEVKFLDVNETRANGPPESWETIAAIRRLKKYHDAKGHTIPDEITKSIIQTIEKYDTNRI